MAENQPITIRTVASFYPDGKVTEKRFIDEFAKPLTLLADLPLIEATGIMEDEADFIEPYVFGKASEVVDLDHGPHSVTYGTYSRKQPMEMREAALEFKKKHKQFVPAAYEATVNLHTSLQLKRTALDMEHDLFYGNPLENVQHKKYMAGLYARFIKLTDEDGVVTNSSDEDYNLTLSTICLGAGGTSSGSLGSAFMIVPGEDATCFVYPNGSELAGMQYEPGADYIPAQDELGGTIYKRTDIFRYTGGLSLRQRMAAVRIANVDYTTTDGMEKFEDVLYRLGDVIPQDLRARATLYIPTKAKHHLRKYFADKVTMITPEYLGFTAAFKSPYIEGIGTIRTTDHMLLTEDKVS